MTSDVRQELDELKRHLDEVYERLQKLERREEAEREEEPDHE